MRIRLAAGLLFFVAARAFAVPSLSNFQSHACLGSTSTTTYVSGNNATVYTTAPDFLVTVSASGLPNLNANDDGTAGPTGTSPVPASLPQISTTAAGLQGAWEFESNGNDSSAAGNNLTFSPANCDAASYGASVVAFMGQAWNPNGACRATAAHNFSFANNFSIDVWIKTSASGSYWPIMASCSGAQNACLELALAPNGGSLNPSFSFGGSGNGLSCSNTVNDSKWHHLAFVYNNPTQKILVDGIPCGANVATMTVTASTIYVGGNASGFGNTNGKFATSGSIDSLRLYNQTFSDGTYALHARGNIYRINGDRAYNGAYSDTFYPSLAAPSQPITSWAWTLPSSGSRVLMSSAPNTVEFAEEDLGENIGFQDYTVNVNQTQLSTPTPTVSFPASDPQHSLTFNMGSYVCDTANTNFLVTFSSGGTRAAAGGAFTLPLTGLTPNTSYGIKASAAYTDTGGSGATVTSGQSSVVSAYTYANVPGAPAITQTGGTSAAVALSTDAGSPPNNAGAANPAGTLIDVEASANGGTSFTQVLSFAPSNSGTLSITGLPKSSSLVFASRAVNGGGVLTSTGPSTSALFVTQPNAPTGFSGAPSTTPGACGKTTIHWSWNAVTQGSNGGAAGTVLGRSGGGGANAACGGVVAGTGCDETGFAPGQQVSDVAQASDTAVGLPYPLSSAVTASAQTASAANGPITFASGTALSGGVQWTWTAPAYLCPPWSYVIHDASSGALLATLSSSPGPAWTQALGPNALSQIVVQAQDPYDSVGAVSSTITAFSQANAPSGLAAASVSMGSLLLSWSANGNPRYTRYEVSLSTSGSAYSIIEPVAANFTSTSVAVGGLSPGASYYFEVRAINGSAALGGSAYTSYATAAFMTSSTAPVLGAPIPDPVNPMTQIDWSWKDVGGVSRYDLVAATTGVIVASVYPPYPATVTVVQTLSGPNSPATDAVVAYNAQGVASASTAVTFFTDSAQPSATAAPVVSASSAAITFAWSANGNPPGTIYQITLSTGPSFGVIVATQSAAGTTGAVTGLFPGTTYFAQVRSVSGSGYPSSSLSLGSAATSIDAQVAIATSPASVYAVGPGLAGLWHFDEGSGTAALDSSGNGDTGALSCASALCASTPAYVAGRPGMGTALDFSGLIGGLVLISSGPQFGFTSALTASAWVLPQSAAMAGNAAIAVKGPQGSEDWFLRVVGGHYQFGVTAGGARAAVLSNATVSADQWTSLIGVFDGAAQKLRLYVNGALDNSASAAGAISASTQPIAIGAGQAVSGGPYNETFTGAIDEVQLAGAAFNDAQAQAYYQSASVSTVTLAGSRKVVVALPPNAFGAPAVIYASQDPINHPLTTNPATLAAGLLNLPTGQVLIPGSLVEIVPIVNGQPFTSPLGSSATIGLPFSASGGLVAGISPPLPASSLRVYTFDPVVSRWTALPTVVDQQAGLASAQTPHFSIFTLLGASSISGDASSARSYPDPWKRGSGGRFDAPALTFDQLPQAGVIRILTLSGEQVVELPFSGSDAGKVQWDGHNAAGRNAASGVYFAYIKPSTGPTKLLKFAIER